MIVHSFCVFCYNSVTNVDSKFDNELDRTGCDILRSGGSWWIVVERSRAWWSDVNDEGTWRSIKYIFSYLHVCRWVYCLFLYILLIYIREHESSKWIIDRWTLKKNTSQVFSCDTSIFSTVCNTRFIWLISRVWTFVPPTWFGDKKKRDFTMHLFILNV